VLLFLNLVWFKYQWQLSMVIYLIIMFTFLLTSKRGGGYNKDNVPDEADTVDEDTCETDGESNKDAESRLESNDNDTVMDDVEKDKQ
jgi:uncharacterized membrane protein YjdF